MKTKQQKHNQATHSQTTVTNTEHIKHGHICIWTNDYQCTPDDNNAINQSENTYIGPNGDKIHEKLQ